MSRTAVAIGNFDGVHRGHQQVLTEAASRGPLAVVTFHPHPVSVLRPEHAPALLTTLEQRIELLKQSGASEVRVVQFSPAVAALQPAEFIDQFVMPLEPGRVVVGKNFRFGARASGDVNTLAELGRERGFTVDALELRHDGPDCTSSTLIRSLVADGRVEEAARHLGRAFTYRGTVVVGDQRGRDLGFPTANLVVEPGLAVPADGVYAGWLHHRGTRMLAAISVGSNPTFDGVQRRVETYVIGRDDLALYGEVVTIEFTAHLRGQVAFTGVDDLVAQMQRDVEQIREMLS